MGERGVLQLTVVFSEGQNSTMGGAAAHLGRCAMQIDKAFSKLNVIQDFIPAGNSNRPGTKLDPSKITIHNTDNASPGADAAAHAKYQKGADARARKVSWHFTVDDKNVFQSLPTNEVGWHAKSGNGSSLGIEICMNPELDVPATYDRAALLTAILARQHGIGVPSGIVQHHSWTGKHCPRILRDKPGGWEEFLEQVVDHANKLTDVPTGDLDGTGMHHDGEGGAAADSQTFRVIASSGLRLRGGPGLEFEILTTLPFGTTVTFLSRSGAWAKVDSSGDGGADGFVHADFLEQV
jgi:hypothetical protein